MTTIKSAIFVIDNSVNLQTYATSDIDFAQTLNKETPTRFSIGDTLTFTQDKMKITDIKIELWSGRTFDSVNMPDHIKTGDKNEYNTLIFLYCDKI